MATAVEAEVQGLEAQCHALALEMIQLERKAVQLDSEFHYHQADMARYARDEVQHARSLLLRQLWLSQRG